MNVSDRIQQRMEQVAQMPTQKGIEYADQLARNALADANYNKALEDDSNWNICENVDDEELERLIKKADAGNIQAMYDTAAVFSLIGHELKKQNDLSASLQMVVKSHLWVDEAQKVQVREDNVYASSKLENIDEKNKNLPSSSSNSFSIVIFFVIWFEIIYNSIRDFFVFWWKITIFDIDFFRNNEDVPIWSGIIVFLFGSGSITHFIWHLLEEKRYGFWGYVLYFFIGYFTSAFIVVIRVFLSPISAIMRSIKGGEKE